MVFEVANGAFGVVASVDANWGELEFYVFFVDESFERLRCFIVQALKLWFETSFCKSSV